MILIDYIMSDHSPIFADVGVNVRQGEPEAPIMLHGRDQGYMWDGECALLALGL